jgi:hypothetical protein
VYNITIAEPPSGIAYCLDFSLIKPSRLSRRNGWIAYARSWPPNADVAIENSQVTTSSLTTRETDPRNVVARVAAVRQFYRF